MITFASIFRQQARLTRQIIASRSLEIMVLQASPVLGLLYGGAADQGASILRPACLLVGSMLLTAHIFVFNDWADYESDPQDPNRHRRPYPFEENGRFQVARIATGLLVLAGIPLALAGLKATVIGALIALLGLLYSGSARFGKTTPLVASTNHLIGGSLHFLLGYSLCHPIDLPGVAISVFFGLVFAAGHLNQEIRDWEGDRVNGIRTCAVVFGCRPAFMGSLLLFGAAYLLSSMLAEFRVLPRLLIWSPIRMLIHLVGAWQALRRGLGYETAVWMQQRYRILLGLVGLAMFFR